MPEARAAFHAVMLFFRSKFVRASCERLIGAILLERHEKWQLESRPYFSMENADLEAPGPAVRQAA